MATLLHARIIIWPWDPGDTQGIVVWAMLDSGATACYMSQEFQRRHAIPLQADPGNLHVTLGAGDKVQATGCATVRISACLIEDDSRQALDMQVHVIQGLNLPFILGKNWLHAIRAIWNFDSDIITLVGGERLLVDSHGARDETQLTVAELDQTLPEMLRDAPEDIVHEEIKPVLNIDGPQVHVQDDNRMQAIVSEHERVFRPLTELPPRRGTWDFRIELKDESALPAKKAPYRMSLREKEASRADTDKRVSMGWIRQSSSAWNSPTLFPKDPQTKEPIPRKDGSLRPVRDYRDLNTFTIPIMYPLPRITELLQRLGGAQFFTKLDETKSFNQSRIREGDEHKSAFITPHGLWESLVMELGMKNSAPHKQGLGDAIIRGDAAALPRYEIDNPRYEEGERNIRRAQGAETPPLDLRDLSGFVQQYVDDIIIFSKTMEEHYEHVQAMLERLDLFDIRINQFNDFGAQTISFLGFRITPNGIALTEERIAALKEWAPPTNVASLWKFFGLVNHYRDFVPRFSMHGQHLTPLLQKGADWKWTEVEQKAFEYLRTEICRGIQLFIPDERRPFIIVSDSSLYGIGGVLCQVDTDGRLRTVAFYSRQTTKAEAKRGQYELEFAGLVSCCRHWRHYLDGADVTVFTDHEPLVTGKVFEQSNAHRHNRIIHRWIAELQQYSIKLKHHPATDSLAQVADSLSRRPDYEENVTKDLSKYVQDIATTLTNDAPADAQTLMSIIMTIDERIQAGWLGADADYMRSLGYELLQDTWYRHGRRVVPLDAQLRKDLIRQHHDDRGHRGATATLRMLQRRFFWPKMRDDVQLYVRQCAKCGREKPRNWRKAGPALPLPVATRAWRNIQVDFIPQLPASTPRGGEGAMTRIATIIDRHSKMVVLIATTDDITTDDFAALFIDHVWKRFGLPDEVHSDSDPLFVARAWARTLDILEVYRKLGAPYNHQATGQVERANQSVEAILRAYVDSDQEWATRLPTVEFTMNSTPHAAIGISPFEMAMGWVPRFGTEAEITVEQAATPAGQQKEQRERIRQFVVGKLTEQQARIANVGPERPFEIEVGQWVYLSTENLKCPQLAKDKRLRQRWIGPYVVLEKMGSRTFGLDIPRHWKIVNRFDIDRLKPCLDDSLPDMEVEVDEDGTVQVIYEVEGIISHRLRGRGNKRVMDTGVIRWKGYDSEFDEEHDMEWLVQQIPHVLNDYVRQNKVKIDESTRKKLVQRIKRNRKDHA